MAEEPTKPRRRGLRLAGYILLGVFSFLFFLYLQFTVVGDAPAERVLVPRLFEQINQNDGIRVEYDRESISGDMFMGMTVRDITVYVEPRRGMLANDPNPEPMLEVDKVRVGLKPFKLLTGKLGASIDADLYSGTLKGAIAASPSVAQVDLTAEGLDLRLHTLLPGKFNVKPAGMLSGTVDLTLPLVEARGGKTVDVTKAEGTVDLALDGAAFEESNVMGIKIPEVSFDDSGARARLSEGTLELERVGFQGPDLTVLIDGDMKVRQNFMMSSINGELTVQMSDSFENQLDPLFKAGIQSGRQSDGVYKYSLRGPLRSLRPRPARSGGRSGRRR